MNDRIAQRLVTQLQKRLVKEFAPDTAVKQEPVAIPPDPTDLTLVEPQQWLSLDPRKTLVMRLIESKYHCDIREILESDTPGVVLAKRFGVNVSTISRWKRRLGIAEK